MDKNLPQFSNFTVAGVSIFSNLIMRPIVFFPTTRLSPISYITRLTSLKKSFFFVFVKYILFTWKPFDSFNFRG